MLALLATTALAQHTRLFETGDEAREWIRHTRSISQRTLTVVGPESARAILPWGNQLDVRFVEVPKGGDLDAAAREARLEDGSPCALVFTPAAEGWAGWVSGSCGRLPLGAWQAAGNRVLDFRGNPLTVAQFASATNDRQMYLTYRKLDRRRGRGIALSLVGSGMLWFSLLNAFEGSFSDLPPAALVAVSTAGAGITTVGVIDLVVTTSNPRSRPRDIGAHISRDEIRSRVIQHNKGLSLFIGPGSAHGTF